MRPDMRDRRMIVRGTRDELVDEATCETYLSLYENSKSRLVHVENANHNFVGIPCRTALTNEVCKICKRSYEIAAITR